MNITRQNYEEWLLLYVDNELSLAERIIVDDFLAANPDIQQELEMLQQSTFQPDEEIVFQNKAGLLRSGNDILAITKDNCEQYFVLYADDELTNEQKAAVEQFVYHQPQFQVNFELILQTRLTPDQSIVFPDKKLLYRTEKKRRVVAMRWYKMAAAAVLLLFVGGVSYKWLVKKDNVTEIVNRIPDSTNNKQNSGLASNDSVIESPVTPAAPPNEGLANAENKAGKSNTDQVSDAGAAKKTKGTAVQIAVPTIPSPITKPREVYVKVDQENNYPDSSNISKPSFVQHTETAHNRTEQPNTGKININTPGKIALNNSNDLAAIAEPSYDLLEDENTEMQPADKKNRMRGIFRKVSRVFEKATNADPSDNRKGNIRIANFEIAIK